MGLLYLYLTPVTTALLYTSSIWPAVLHQLFVHYLDKRHEVFGVKAYRCVKVETSEMGCRRIL